MNSTSITHSNLHILHILYQLTRYIIAQPAREGQHKPTETAVDMQPYIIVNADND